MLRFSGTWVACGLLAVWIGVPRAALAGAKGPSRFEVQKLRVDGDVLAVVADDLDGDRRADLMVSFRKGRLPNDPRFLAVFWNRSSNFGSRPDLVLNITSNAAAFDVAEIDDKPGADWLTIDRHGVSSISFSGRKIGPVIRQTSDTTIFFRPNLAEFPRVRLIHNVTQDATKIGRDLLVPMLGELAIYRQSPTGYVQSGRLDLEMNGEISQEFRPPRAPGILAGFATTFAFPTIHVADSDGDRLADIFVTGQGKLNLYRQRSAGVFAALPSIRRDFRDHGASKENFTMASVTVTDFDRDGLADLLVTRQLNRGIASITATSSIYLGRSGGNFANVADQTLTTAGPAMAEVIDLSGDGRSDLVIPTVNLGVWQIIRVLTSKSLNVALEAYIFQANRRFPAQPTGTREVRFQFSLSGNTGLQAVEFRGDYNGDGQPDLAFGVAKNELAIFIGATGSNVFGARAIETIQVHTHGTLEPVDLDGKGRSDIILYNNTAEAERGKIVVLINRGPW